MNYVTIKKFSELTGYSEKALNSKIDNCVWVQDKEYVIAPDGRRLISISGVEKWAESKRAMRKVKFT